MRSLLCLAFLFLLSAPGLSQADPTLGISPEASWPRAGARVALLVHGINPVHEDLDALAADLQARGMTVLRFVYDDSDRLDLSAERLARGIEDLARKRGLSRLDIVAHSMGGLVARRALTQGHGLEPLGLEIKFLSVASPFGGFGSANWSRLDMGLGRKVFRDLGTRSSFIREPGELIRGVAHTKVETDEHNHTHRGQDDDSVPLKSQAQAKVDAAAARRFRLSYGHVGSISDEEGRVPAGLQAILSEVLGPRRGRGARAPAPGLVQRLSEDATPPPAPVKRKKKLRTGPRSH